MRTAKHSHVSRALGRAKRIWSELDYAQRRLFELRTGVPSTTPERRPSLKARIDELERLYAYSDPRFSER